jgi:non-specific serine/threonine protein kinase
MGVPPLLLAALLLAGCGHPAQPATAASSPPPAPASPSAQPSPTTPPPQWRALPPAPSQRSEVTGAALGGRIYLTGGLRTGGYTTDTVEIFDTATGQWSTGPHLPIGVNHAMSAAAAGTLFVFGGYLGDYRISAAAYRLDGGRWRRIADMPAGRAAGTAAVVGDRVYLPGGVAPDKSLADQMLVYDPGSDRWSTAPGPPTKREHLGGAALGGRVYTVGGRASHGAGIGNLDAVEAFDPATGQWSTLPALPTARGGLAAATTCDGRIVAVGGEGSATFPQVEAFDPKTGRWQTLTPLPNPRHGLGVVVVGKVLYVLTGGPKPGPYMSNTAEALDLCP